MATITTNTFLDQGIARTAGEAWVLNGAVLTIRTDTRWHSNSPASMTGSIGATTISATLGGGILIDSTNVRWMPYNTGTGTVPAIGTIITQGGISGYLLGVWSSYTSAPLTVGSAMPVSGYLKFREVTGGTYSIGLLVGIGANATASDRQGWIEIVQDQAVANIIPRLGYYRTRGSWFELDQLTSGNPNDVIQIPTNGGGAATHVPAIWIETSPGSNQYEVYPAILNGFFLAANLSTDIRSKFVLSLGSGQLRIGYDGTTNTGYVPPAGCKIRIPSNIGRQTSAVNRALNLIPHATFATRPDFTVSGGGEIDFEYFINDWYHLFNSAYKIQIKNGATFDIHSSSNEASPMLIENFTTGSYTGTAISLILLANPLGGIIRNCKFFRVDAAANGHTCTITTTSNLEIDNCYFGTVAYTRSTGQAIVFNQCRNITMTDNYLFCGALSIITCSNMNIFRTDYTDRLRGVTNATTGKNFIVFTSSCSNILVDEMTFGMQNNISEVNPYLAVIVSTLSSDIIIRNLGSFINLLSCQTTNSPQYLFQDGGQNDGIRIQRCYLERTRTSLYLTVNTSKNITFENIYSTIGSLQTLSLNTLVKSVRAASNSVTVGASVYGTHIFDMFIDDNNGRIWWAMNEPTSFSSDYVTLTLVGSRGGFTSGGQVAMPTIGDELIIESPYYIIGHGGFVNIAPTLTGTNTGNFSYEYDIDINDGNGFTGSYKILNGTNLSSEVVDSSSGFKLKLRIITITASTTNNLSYIRINTITDIATQETSLYPLDYTNINLSGFVLGTRIQIYNTNTNEELYNNIPSSTTLNFVAPYSSDFDCRIRVMYSNATTAKKFIEFLETVTLNGLTRTLIQENDQVYIDNTIDGSTITTININDTTQTIEIDSNTISWQDIYAYETYWLTTEQGIRDEGRFIDAIDKVNYIVYNFKIKNITIPSIPLEITNGYAVDSITKKSITLIDNTGGTIFNSPDHVIPFSTSGGGSSGDTKEDIYTYFTSSGRQNTFKADISTLSLESTSQSIKTKVDTLDNTDLTGLEADLIIINEGVKKASKLIPHNTNL